MAIIRNKPPEHSNAGKATKVVRLLRAFDAKSEPTQEEYIDAYALLNTLSIVARGLTGGEDEWFSRN